MMEEIYARQLGRYINMDPRYAGYLRVRVEFLLSKTLVPSISDRVKGRGMMNIMIHYENVPHFYFVCGRMGHAALNCEEGIGDRSIKFGEDLRASPPKRVREINMKQVSPRVARPLFQTRSHIGNVASSESQSRHNK
jgi:hypothetical protein